MGNDAVHRSNWIKKMLTSIQWNPKIADKYQPLPRKCAASFRQTHPWEQSGPVPRAPRRRQPRPVSTSRVWWRLWHCIIRSHNQGCYAACIYPELSIRGPSLFTMLGFSDAPTDNVGHRATEILKLREIAKSASFTVKKVRDELFNRRRYAMRQRRLKSTPFQFWTIETPTGHWYEVFQRGKS